VACEAIFMYQFLWSTVSAGGTYLMLYKVGH